MRIRHLFCLSIPLVLLGGTLPRVAIADSKVAEGPPLSDPRWNDYQIIMWQDQTPARLGGLARLGITAGNIHGRGDLSAGHIAQQTAPFQALGLHWYIENIATDFYSAYHRWFPDRPKTWLFDEAKRMHELDPASMDAFTRLPSLSDPVWMGRIADRLQQHVRAFHRPLPLFFNLADEAGTADLAAAWDFDFGRDSLDGMRTWLQQQYPTLDALNKEWGTDFSDWSQVIPMMTDAALLRSDGNFAAWADFKAWMDVAFARAIRSGTDAVHAADPQALAGLEGGQIPGWGGYDYTRLPSTVDVMELYDFGNNVEIAHSLNPGLILMQTTSLANDEDIHGVWHELLLGERGLVLWDDNEAFVEDDGAPTERGKVLSALATELRSGIATQLFASTQQDDPVAILYSPASLHLQWLLDRKADGKPWAARMAETEYDEDNPARAAMRESAKLLTHLGVSPHWLGPASIEKGELQARHIRVLVLPHTLALSSAAAGQIRDFVAHGGTVLTDAEPALFDEHGRRLAEPLLADLVADGHMQKLPELFQGWPADKQAPLVRLRRVLELSGAAPSIILSSADGQPATDVDARLFHNVGTTIIGLQRDRGAKDAPTDEKIVLELAAPAYIYDLRHPGPPRHAARIEETLDAVTPALLALMQTPLPPLALARPTSMRQGATATLTVTGQGVAAGTKRVVHIEAIAPDGTVARTDTVNLIVAQARTSWRLSLAPDAPPGDWTLRMTDLLGGRTSETRLVVQRRPAAGRSG